MQRSTVSPIRGNRSRVPTRRATGRNKSPARVAPVRTKTGLGDWLERAEPRFAALYAEARAVAPDACASIAWSRLKRKLVDIVGWDAENPFLRQEATFEHAVRLLVAELPACACCGGAR